MNPRAAGDRVLRDRAGQRVVFENKEHDSPQRVIYWRAEKNRLHARIEGVLDGRVQAEEWAWGPLR